MKPECVLQIPLELFSAIEMLSRIVLVGAAMMTIDRTFQIIERCVI